MKDKILIIDADPTILLLMQQVLETAGYEVLAALDGESGLKQFDQFQPDLIILDIMLPNLDGWEICRRVRKTSAIPIIVHTALESEKEISQALRLGIDDYLIKPLVPKMLLARIEAVMNQQAELSQTIWLQWSANLLRHLPVSR